MKQSSQKIAACFLNNLAKDSKSAPSKDYDLATLIPDKVARREFAEDIASYFQDRESLRTLEEDSDYDPTTIKQWMVAEYLAFLLDPSLDRRSKEQREKQQWKDQEKFYDMLLNDMDESLNQNYSQEELEALKRVQRRLDKNE